MRIQFIVKDSISYKKCYITFLVCLYSFNYFAFLLAVLIIRTKHILNGKSVTLFVYRDLFDKKSIIMTFKLKNIFLFSLSQSPLYISIYKFVRFVRFLNSESDLKIYSYVDAVTHLHDLVSWNCCPRNTDESDFLYTFSLLAASHVSTKISFLPSVVHLKYTVSPANLLLYENLI